MGMDIDESGADDATVHVHHPARFAAAQRPDRRDPVPLQTHIG